MNGHPTTLVLLPGLDGTGKLFKPLLNALPLSIRTQVIGYPGDRLLALNDYAEWVKERLPPGRIIMLAESFSGPVALTLLSMPGKLLDAVIFSASFAEPPRPLLLQFAPLVACAGVLLRTMPDFTLRWLCLGMEASTDQITLVRETLAEVSPRVLAHRLKLIATPHSFLQAHFKTPCYYFQGMNDRLVPPEAANWFKNHFESFQLEHLAAPHFLLQVKPLECVRLVTQILETESAESRIRNIENLR